MNTLAGFLLLLLAAPGLTSNSNRDSGVPGIKYQVQKPPLTTPWTQEAGIDPWPEYPRPQLQRSQWKSLNGIWRYQNASSLLDISSLGTEPATWREVLVPSCLESGLSGGFYASSSACPSNNVLLRQEFKATTPSPLGWQPHSMYQTDG